MNDWQLNQARRQYGNMGIETLEAMIRVLENASYSIAYDRTSERFTIHNTAGVDKGIIEEIFSQATYVKWGPHVLDEIDSLGNRLVKLVVLDSILSDVEDGVEIPVKSDSRAIRTGPWLGGESRLSPSLIGGSDDGGVVFFELPTSANALSTANLGSYDSHRIALDNRGEIFIDLVESEDVVSPQRSCIKKISDIFCCCCAKKNKITPTDFEVDNY